MKVLSLDILLQIIQLDEDGNIIPVDTTEEDLPEKYHILTGSVIYRAYTDPELKDRSERLNCMKSRMEQNMSVWSVILRILIMG